MAKEKKHFAPCLLGVCVCVWGLLWSWFFLRLEIVKWLVDKDIITIVVLLMYYYEDDNDDDGLLCWGWVIGLITGRTRNLSLMAVLERLREVIPPFRTSHLDVFEVLRFPAHSLEWDVLSVHLQLYPVQHAYVIVCCPATFSRSTNTTELKQVWVCSTCGEFVDPHRMRKSLRKPSHGWCPEGGLPWVEGLTETMKRSDWSIWRGALISWTICGRFLLPQHLSLLHMVAFNPWVRGTVSGFLLSPVGRLKGTTLHLYPSM